MRKLIFALVGLVLMAGCSSSDDSSPAAATIDTSLIARDLPVIDGSTSTQPLRMFIVCAILDVSCDWEELIDGSRRVLPAEGVSFEPFDAAVPSSGTHGSYVALAENNADLILTARMPAEDELELAAANGVEFDIAPIALDAFVFLINRTNPVRGLTLDEARDIFSGEIRNWEQVGGDDRPIQPYQRNETSGSQVLMKRLVMNGTTMIDAPNMMLPTMMAPFDAISRDEAGIGYSVFFFATQMLAADEVRLLGIDGTEPTSGTIASGGYPLVTEVYAVLQTDAPPQSPARLLRDWLVTDPGRGVVDASGYVPIP